MTFTAGAPPAPVHKAGHRVVRHLPQGVTAGRGTDRVQYALTVGRWTDDDAQALQAALPYLTQDQTMEVSEMLLPAMNRGEIAVETNGPPF
jgi:hypothetical protein